MKKRMVVVLASLVALLAANAAPARAEGPTALAGEAGGYWSESGLGPFSFSLTGLWKGEGVPFANYTCFGSWTAYVRGAHEGIVSCSLDQLADTQGGAPAGLTIDARLAADEAGLFSLSGYVQDADLPFFKCAGTSLPAAVLDGPYLRGACHIT